MRNFFKSIFPMSAKGTEDRVREIQAQMDRQQDITLSKVEQVYQKLGDIADAMHTELETVQEQNRQMMKCAIEQQKIAFGEMDQLARKLDELAEQPVCRELLQQLKEQLSELETYHQQLMEQVKRTTEEVHEIRVGDLFRRIEFVQGKQVLLESTLQRNLLSMEDQKRSEEYAFITRMRALFPVQQVASEKRFVRIGRNHDGGYLMLDDFAEKKIAYSIGIANDVSWDQDMVDRGLDVYMYDHTIEGLPYEHEKFHYFKIGLGASPNPAIPQLKTLSQMMTENGHMGSYGMILKIDIEGAEWDVIAEIDQELLTHFSQIVFEFHNLIFPKCEERIKTAMEKLNKTHQLVHLHPNNYGGYLQIGGKVLSELIEGTYLLRSEYLFTQEPLTFPTPQDEINSIYLPDIYLGSWDT